MSSAAEAILQTVAGSPLADPQRRAAAQLALLLGSYDPHATVADIVAAANKGAPGAGFSIADLLREATGEKP